MCSVAQLTADSASQEKYNMSHEAALFCYVKLICENNFGD
jgi:hypothetical protein